MSGMSPAGFTSRCAELVALVPVGAAEVAVTGAVDAASGAEVRVELSDDVPGISLVDDEDVLVVVAALDVLAMLVDVTAAGEELPHAATPISPAKTAKTPDAVRNVDFTGAP